jgi:serine/threonine-protein phosphatase 6 regulatory subunit 3
MPSTIGDRMPLGFERLKICELFAELLHCSNMAHLNKPLAKHHIARSGYMNTFGTTATTEEEEGIAQKTSDTATESDKTQHTEAKNEEEEELYIADHLKLQLIKHRVLPTCLVCLAQLFAALPSDIFTQ